MDSECLSKHADDGEQELQASSSTEDDPSEQTRSSNAMEGPPSADIPQQSQFDISSDGPTRDGATRLVLPNHSAQNGTGTEHSVFLEDDKNREHKRARRSKNWTRSETLKLIEMRTALDERFQRSGRKAMLWEEIAVALQKDKFSRDGQQCKDKWEKLTAAYKEVRDGMRESREHPFFNELNALLSWKSYKKEIDGGSDVGNPRSVKIELNSGPAFLSWNQGGVSYVLNPHLPTVGMAKVQFDHGFGSLDSKDVLQRSGVNSMDAGETRRPARSSPKKQKRDEQICSLDCKAVQELLESIITRQQNFVKDWLDALDRKAQLKEQRRHEREEKWREEERAQRLAFNSMMIRLTQRLLSERRPPAMEVMPSGTMAAATSNGVFCPKKRSKNWKKSEVTNLICVRQEMESKFLMSTRRAALWDELGEKLGTMGTHRDGKQCREKWDKLMAEFKDVVDGRKDKDESAYFEQLSRFMAAGKDGDLKTPLEKIKDDGATGVKDDACVAAPYPTNGAGDVKDDACVAAPYPTNGAGDVDHVA